WDGNEQTAWVVPTQGGGHEFVTDDHKTDWLTPGFCPVGGHCGVAGQIYFQDGAGKHYEALLNYGNGTPSVAACSGNGETCGPSSSTTTSLTWTPSTPTTGQNAVLTATVSRNCQPGDICPTPTGAVTFVVDDNGVDKTICDSVPLTNGQTTCHWL